MKKLVFLLIMVLPAGVLTAQKTFNDPNAEKRDISGFHGIEVSTGIKLYLTEGSTEGVAVSADKNEFRDKIVTKVEKGILKIHYETQANPFKRKDAVKDLRAYVSYTKLDYLYANTGASVDMDGVLRSGSLDLKVNTGAVVKAALELSDLKIGQSTGSLARLSGKADKLVIDGSTGSKLMGEELDVNNCTVSVNTGAMVWIQADKELHAHANTGGLVKYKGAAQVKEIKTSIGGRVSKI